MKAKKTGVKKYVAGGVIGGAIQGGLGLAQTIYGGIQANKARKEMERVRATAPSLDTPSEYMKLYKESFNNDLLNRQMESLKSTTASSIGALGQAGGRALLGGIQGVSANQAQQAQAATDVQQLRQLGALEKLAGANRDTQQMRENRYNQDLKMAQGFFDAGMQNVAGGIGAVGKGAAYMFAEDNPFKKTKAPGGGDSSGSTSGSSSQYNFSRRSPQNIQDAFDEMEDLKQGSGEKGMVVKTKGKFSHKENPIHMVQDGEKVGEMTGGEYVFNPEQMANIKALSKQDPKKLSTYIKSLIKKFNSK
jgi:hypothetical protein